jgi:N-acetylmuramoyl-L-alanine amidase
MKNGIILILFLILFGSKLHAQPELRLVSGQQDTVRNARHFFRGMTTPNSQLSVNDVSFPVYATGAFAAEVNLVEGQNTVNFVVRHGGKETVSDIAIYCLPLQVPQVTSRFEIEQAELIPNLSMVYPGDVLKIKVKTLPGCTVGWLNGNRLEELPADAANGMAGIYQGRYVVKENDPLLALPITVTVKNGTQSISKEIAKSITVVDPLQPIYVRTKGAYPYLNYGLGQDRLGGSKIGYLSPGIDMKVLGKVDRLYKVQLSKQRSAWIPESEVENPTSQKLFKPDALTSSWSVYGDNRYDYVKISLSDKLPYRSFQEVNPARIIVDICGVATNTAWITQLPTVKTITNVNYEQIEDDVLRIFIDLKGKQHWGYGVYYENNQLVVRVKHPPKLQLKGLRIALDAGHGGESDGAVGTTGMKEKDVNLELVLMLKAELEKQGAHIILTRSDDSDISMQQRLSFLNQQKPDLLVSIHNKNFTSSSYIPLATFPYVV